MSTAPAFCGLAAMHSKQFARLVVFIGFLILSCGIEASSDAGIDLHLGNVEVLVTYSVALDYAGEETCIRNPDCLLFPLVTLLQNSELKPHQAVVLQFDLYQSDKRKGNWLSLVMNPFEGEAPFKELYDGKARSDLAAQITSVLEHELVSSRHHKKGDAVFLFKCVDKRTCKDIKFGSFPSDEEHTGYCLAPEKGCSHKPITIHRKDMKKYFFEIPE